jgi:hypothetical protein
LAISFSASLNALCARPLAARLFGRRDGAERRKAGVLGHCRVQFELRGGERVDLGTQGDGRAGNSLLLLQQFLKSRRAVLRRFAAAAKDPRKIELLPQIPGHRRHALVERVEIAGTRRRKG